MKARGGLGMSLGVCKGQRWNCRDVSDVTPLHGTSKSKPGVGEALPMIV